MTELAGLLASMESLGAALSADVEERDARGAKDPADWLPLWRQAAETGLLGLGVPKGLGGSELSASDVIKVVRHLGYHCRDNGMLLGLNGQIWAMQMSILEFGSDAQKARWFPGFLDGTAICAHAVTEEASGSNAMAMQCRAEKTDAGYRITGDKIWIGMGPVAHVAQVFAVTNPDHGPWGLSTFLIDTSLPGVVRGEQFDKAGHRTVPAGVLRFDGVEVPDDARMGPEGAGQSIFNWSIDLERRFIFAGHVGAMKRHLDETVAFARERAPGGIAIDTHQNISQKLAEMRMRYETCAMMLERAARELDDGIDNKMTAPMAKVMIAEALLENAQDALRIRGGAGYKVGETERMLRDAAGCITLGGTSDIQKRIIAALQRAGG